MNIYRYREQIGSCQRWVVEEGWAKWVRMAKRYKLPVIR